MRTKSHKKQSILGYWWSELLFTKRFTFETALTPEACAERLKGLAPLPDAKPADKHEPHVLYSGEGDYSFHVTLHRYTKRAYDPVAFASGRIFADQRGVTLVTGFVRFTPSAYLALLFILIVVFGIWFWITSAYDVDDPVMTLWLVFGVWMIIVYWVAQISARNRLLNAIRNALFEEKAKHHA